MVMDKASFHKSLQTKAILKKAGCPLVFLLPYILLDKVWGVNEKRNRKIKGEEIHHLTRVLHPFFTSIPELWIKKEEK